MQKTGHRGLGCVRFTLQPRIRLNSWKHLVCSSQADFDETFTSAELAFHAKTFRSNKKGRARDRGCQCSACGWADGDDAIMEIVGLPKQKKAAPKKLSSLE
eukprot:2117554-Amphidinium_carterae.1